MATQRRVETPAGTAPRTETEREMAALWAEVLGREQIGVDENFFDAGGHSLLATRIVSRIRARHAQDFSLRELFAAPTIAALAAVLDSRRQAQHGSSHLQRCRVDTALPLSFGQERLWFLDQLDPGSAAYNIAWTLRLSGALDRGALRAALDFLVARHESLRSRFPAVGWPATAVHRCARAAAVARTGPVECRRGPSAGRTAAAMPVRRSCSTPARCCARSSCAARRMSSC